MKTRIFFIITGLLLVSLAGCGREANGGEQPQSKEQSRSAGDETAQDGSIDFEALTQENPDIFAWLYVPGTDIDAPILQSGVADDYYESHDVTREASDTGALYTEMANLMNMCDFNTIIHGKDQAPESLFYDLHSFENPDFFEQNKNFYIYLPDNVLTYEIRAAYYDEGSDILRRYDYTSLEGCQTYLDSLPETSGEGINVRESKEELTPYHYLVTLNGSTGAESTNQYVIVGVLVGDAAGKIDRIILN